MPWSVSPKARANPQNGLCLCVLHDKAYDVGIITISPSYEVAVSSLITASHAPMSRYTLVAFAGQTIRKPHRFVPRPEYLEWHTKNVFHA